MARKRTSANTRRRTTKGDSGRGGTQRGSARSQARRGGGRTEGGERSSRKSGAARTSEHGRAAGRGRGNLLSRSTLRAKWIDSPDEHADYPGQTLATRNHDVIRRWAEERGAQPATVPGTEHDGHAGVLTFDFPGYGGERLQPITWDEWFRAFDERNLVFVFQENLKDGRPSNHFNLDSPEREAA